MAYISHYQAEFVRERREMREAFEQWGDDVEKLAHLCSSILKYNYLVAYRSIDRIYFPRAYMLCDALNDLIEFREAQESPNLRDAVRVPLWAAKEAAHKVLGSFGLLPLIDERRKFVRHSAVVDLPDNARGGGPPRSPGHSQAQPTMTELEFRPYARLRAEVDDASVTVYIGPELGPVSDDEARSTGVQPIKIFADAARFLTIDDRPFLVALHAALGERLLELPANVGAPLLESMNHAAAQGDSPGLFVPTDLQRAILDALDGVGLTKERLAEKIGLKDGSRFYRDGGLSALVARGLVANKRGVGYYRPDRPPPGSLVVAPTLPQDAPVSPPVRKGRTK